MDLTSRIKEFPGRQNNLRSWFLTTLLPQSIVLVGGNRLLLLLMGQHILRRTRPSSAITTEAEALSALKELQPGLLIVASPLEEGDAISLCRKARQQQAKLKILLILDRQESSSAFLEIDNLLDAVLHTLDIGDDEYPLVKAFMAILRGGRGLSDRQIATSLGLSYETARTYVKTVRRKLGSSSRVVAAAWSWRRRPGS